MSQQAQPQPLTVETEMPSFTLRELLAYFLRLGTFDFGGPVALAGHADEKNTESVMISGAGAAGLLLRDMAA